MNNNFSLNDVIKYYEKQDYIFYNLSDIKNLKDYIKFEKYKNDNKNKLITYINFLSCYNNKLIIILLKIFNYNYSLNYKYNNSIIFYYKDKYFITNNKRINNIKNLLDIQNILFNKFYKCNICFNEKCFKINLCIQCNLQTCNICNKKLKKINNICCCCKYSKFI
jgi:hypothetical protein